MLSLLKRNWAALLVVGLYVRRVQQGESPWSAEAVCLGIAMLGLQMNIAVIIANGGTPVAVTEEQISDDQRGSHHPIDDRTKLKFLSDWIDVGFGLYSPGDVVIDVGVAGLIAVMLCRAIW